MAAGGRTSTMPRTRAQTQPSLWYPSGTIRYGRPPPGRRAGGGETAGAERFRGGESDVAGRSRVGVSATDGSFSQDVAGIRGSHRSGAIAELPGDHIRFSVEGRTYYRVDWTFYEARHYGGKVIYAEIPAPYGTVVASLPPGHETFVIGGRDYYYCDNAYFVSAAVEGRAYYVVTEPPTQISAPVPMQLLRQMSDYLAGVQQFTVDTADAADRVLESGQRARLVTRRKLYVRRPDTMRVDSQGDHIDRSIWYDGSSLAMLERTQNVYAVNDMPSTIDNMLDEVAVRFAVHIPLADLLYSDIYKALITDTRTNAARYIGETRLDEVDCHHLAFESTTTDWEIWIEVGDRPLPRKLEVAYKHDQKRPRYVVTLREWNLSPQFPHDHFVFRPSPGAEQIQLLPAVRGHTEATPAAVAQPRE